MRKGFTLIELLVVIAIIAILAAILFPVFMRAKTVANTQKCMSHGRELGLAMLSYMDDNGGRYPADATADMLAKFSRITWRYQWPIAGYPERVWSVGSMNQFAYIQLAPYVKNSQIWICPAPMTLYAMKYAYGYRNSWFFRGGNPGVPANYPDCPFTYNNPSDPNDPRNGDKLTLAEVAGLDLKWFRRYCPPSKKFFAWCYALGPEIPVSSGGTQPVTVTPAYAHDEGSVYVFADGHAKYKEIGCGFAPVGYTNAAIDKPHR